jgi:dienelactone hydrolase
MGRATLALALAGGSAMACAADVVTTEVETGALSATLYAPADHHRHPALLVLGGAEGGREWARGVARQLAQEGYVALAQSYFNGPGLPKALASVPIERFQHAVDYLQALPSVQPGQLGVVGLSKGAEAALVLAAHESRLRVVVAAAPSDVVWQGIDRSGGAPASSWSFHGAPLAFVPFHPCPQCRGLLDLYRNSHPHAVVADHIEGKGIAAPVLLVASEQDQVWPSTAMARALAARLRREGNPHVSVIDYPAGGHFAFGLTPTAASAREDTGFGGGTPEGLVAARKDSWKRVLAFLGAAFKARG